jgi:hypothetical protein
MVLPLLSAARPLSKSVKGMDIPKTGLLVIHKTRQKTKQEYSTFSKFLC